MDYINRLQQEIEYTKNEKIKLKEKLDNLMRYINSKKFHCGNPLDGYVNTSDIKDHIIPLYIFT